MSKLKTMRAGVKSRYAKEKRDVCFNEDCGVEIKVGDKYATTGERSTHGMRHVYCEQCAKEKWIV